MISVCMATYNGEHVIERQLRSILSQLTNQDEIVIIDDSSTDNTIKKIEMISQEYNIPLQIHSNSNNLGPIKSFEKALSLAEGDYLFLSDQDDEWFSNKIETILSTFKSESSDLIIHDGIVVNEKKQVLDESWNHYNNNHVYQDIIGNIKKNAFTGAMMALSNNLAEKVIPFPNNIEMHDQWIFLVAKKRKLKISVVNKPLMFYIRHGKNVTGMKKRPFRRQLIGRIKTAFNYLKIKN